MINIEGGQYQGQTASYSSTHSSVGNDITSGETAQLTLFTTMISPVENTTIIIIHHNDIASGDTATTLAISPETTLAISPEITPGLGYHQ